LEVREEADVEEGRKMAGEFEEENEDNEDEENAGSHRFLFPSFELKKCSWFVREFNGAREREKESEREREF